MPTTRVDECPICGGTLVQAVQETSVQHRSVCCHNCGEHEVQVTAIWRIGQAFSKYPDRARIAYGVRKLSRDATLTADHVQQFAERIQLPDAMERVDHLVLFAGEMEPGSQFGFVGKHMQARLGCESEEAAEWVCKEAVAAGYFHNQGTTKGANSWRTTGLVMTTQGWRRRAELLREGAGSKHAFMAMRFGDVELDRVFREHMVPAVKDAGFDLRTTNGPHQTAGSIDNRMRVEIRTSRFLVCDLTHGNRGAYWEAGFAEGLGRPVFYVCRADVLASEDREIAPHFDTRQQLIIAWDRADPTAGMQALKDAIRNTLFDLARMKD